jgi:hypothetical protein
MHPSGKSPKISGLTIQEIAPVVRETVDRFLYPAIMPEKLLKC